MKREMKGGKEGRRETKRDASEEEITPLWIEMNRYIQVKRDR